MPRLPLVSPLERVLFLKAQPYLEGLPSNILAALASYTHENFYPAGREIRAAGAPIKQILFLGEGAVEISGSAPDEGPSFVPERRIDSPGAIGLADHFAGTPRPPAVRAVEGTLGIEISTTDLDQILEDHFPLLLQVARTSALQTLMTFEALTDAREPEAGFESGEQRETPVQIDLVQRLARARRAPLFRGTNLTVLSELLRDERPEHVAPGEALWREGDPIDRMVLVLDGSFHSEGKLGRCEGPAGATLGAWEILAETSRWEGWIAQAPSRVISIPKDLFVDVLEDHFEFAQAYLRRISRKLLRGWQALALGRSSGTEGRVVSSFEGSGGRDVSARRDDG